jgi:hypothetical protein
LGGDLIAASTEGEGSAFTMTIPLKFRDEGCIEK